MINFDKFVYFCDLQLQTGDYDAHIPLLKHLHPEPTEDGVWLGLMYMAFYNEASAWHWVTYANIAPAKLPIETQRRNLYGGRILPHLDHIGQMRPWLQRLQRCDTWADLLTLLESPYGNGRWASYTTADLMLDLAGLDHLQPDLFSISRSSGPKGGLEDLGLVPSEVSAGRVLNDLEDALCRKIKVSHLESLLCDWHGMCKGTFYAGRNIDRQQGRIVKVAALTGLEYDELWAARRAIFPENSLGELRDWEGIDKDRLSHYSRTQEVLAPWESR